MKVDDLGKSRDNVVVIGGGVIGAFCGWYLCRAGHRVTIVERTRFGGGCSHGNCGYVSPSHVLPLPRPGAVREAMASMLQKNSPLKVRLRFSPTLWHWLYRFMRRCNQHDMLDAGVARNALLQSSKRLYQQFVAEEQVDCEWTEKGLLCVFATRKHFDEFEATNALLTRHFRMPAKRLGIDELVAMEPALKDDLAGAWYYAGDCHLRPDKLMDAMRVKLEQAGCRIVENFEVEQFEIESKRCRAIVSQNAMRIESDAFVVATGAWTPFLNKHLGCRIPIQPGKGYSLTMPQPARMPRYPLILEEQRVAITPLRNKYRIGSTMEFAGYDSSIKPARLNLLKTSAARYLHEPYCLPIEEEWFGWRPMTWDGKPIIDRSPAMNNVWIAAGHNMIGISMATGTGLLIQELIDAVPPHIDPAHYSLSRF